MGEIKDFELEKTSRKYGPAIQKQIDDLTVLLRKLVFDLEAIRITEFAGQFGRNDRIYEIKINSFDFPKDMEGK